MNNSPAHSVFWTDEQLLRACEVRFVRRSGPGGQHRNKVSSGVQLLFGGNGLIAEASERRSQADNRRVALARLRRLLAVNVRCRWEPAGPLPELWRSRVQGGKIVVNPEHRDVPGLLAIALDCLAALDWDTGRAAEALGCSTTQLVRFLGTEPLALGRLNEERRARGLKALHGG